MKKPKISIITPCYNTEKFIVRCLESIKNQTLQEWECIVIDDGSSDNTKNLIAQISKTDKRFIPVYSKHIGVSAARNIGLRMAEGEYIGFVDSDDWIEPDMFDMMIQKSSETGCDIVKCCYNNVHFTSGVFNIENPPEHLNLGYTASNIYKHKPLLDNSIFFNERLSLCEDLLFGAQAFGVLKNICVIDNELYHYSTNNPFSLSIEGTFKKTLNRELLSEMVESIQNENGKYKELIKRQIQNMGFK